MNLSLARPQQRNQAGSEPNLHGWAGLRLGPGSFLDTGVNEGPFADLLIFSRGRGCPSWKPQWSSVLLDAQRPLCPERSPSVFSRSLSLFAQVSHRHCLLCVTRKTGSVLQLSSVPRTGSGVTLACLETCSYALRGDGGTSEIITSVCDVGAPGSPRSNANMGDSHTSTLISGNFRQLNTEKSKTTHFSQASWKCKG